MIYTTFIGCKTFSLLEIYKPFLVITPGYSGYPQPENSGYPQQEQCILRCVCKSYCFIQMKKKE